jgi:maltose/maltodextrin transport system permease protein
VVFPFLIVLSVSPAAGQLRQRLADPAEPSAWSIGATCWACRYPGPDGQPILPDLPVLRWLWNSVKVAALSRAW